MDFKISQIETITNDFSENLKVGSGGFGVVYKGWYDGKHIAVKRLQPLKDLDDKQFKSEFNNLTNVSHKNVVRIIGYCCESRSKYEKHKGKNIWVESLEPVLCFEYMEGGNLEKHIAAGPCELDWPMCYNIIIGICEGLNHLHNAQENPIFHLDLKPANILLDKSMMPKIADLGLSRVFPSLETHETKNIKGTNGYMPPEYINSGAISNKFDVFSLGVIIIQMLDGHEGYFRCSDVSSKQFIELVSQKWAKRLQAMPGPNSSHKIDILRVSRCAEIALRCIDKDRKKRPSIQDIVRELEELDAKIKNMPSSSNLSKDLTVQRNGNSNNVVSVDPALELRFHFEAGKDASSCLQLTNMTDGFIAFNIQVNQYKYKAQPSHGTMRPCSKCYIVVKMEAQANAPPDMQCHDTLLVRSASVTQEQASDLKQTLKAMMEKGVDVVKLPIVYVTLEE